MWRPCSLLFLATDVGSLRMITDTDGPKRMTTLLAHGAQEVGKQEFDFHLQTFNTAEGMERGHVLPATPPKPSL